MMGTSSINIQLFSFYFSSPLVYITSVLLPRFPSQPTGMHSPSTQIRRPSSSQDVPSTTCVVTYLFVDISTEVDFKERNLFGMAIIEPLPFGHAVKFALARSFQIWDPVVVLALKKLLVVLGTLFLPAKNNICLSSLSLYIWLSFSV